MELVIEPDVYSPSIGENGNYVDKIPSFNLIKKRANTTSFRNYVI